jgi:hypothetical protein
VLFDALLFLGQHSVAAVSRRLILTQKPHTCVGHKKYRCCLVVIMRPRVVNCVCAGAKTKDNNVLSVYVVEVSGHIKLAALFMVPPRAGAVGQDDTE